MSQVLKSINSHCVHLDSYCLNCNSLIDKVTRNQKFCSTKTGRECAKQFKQKVKKKLELVADHNKAAIKWQLYHPTSLKIIRDRYVSKNLIKVRKSRSAIAKRHKLIKRVIKLDFMPILVGGKIP